MEGKNQYRSVSFIMPVYNACRTLETSISSVLNQTERNISLIAVDDGSADDSNEILSEIAFSDTRVIICSKQNKGVSNTRNVGMGLSISEYISFIDADDIIDPHFAEACEESIREYGVDLCAAGFQAVWLDKAGRVLKKEEWQKSSLVPYKKVIDHSEIEERILKPMTGQGIRDAGTDLFCSSCGKLFCRELIANSSLVFNEMRNHAEDWEFGIEYLARAKSLYIIDRPMYNYMRYAGMETLSNRCEENQFQVSLYWHFHLRKLFPHWSWDEIKDIKSYTGTPMYSMKYYFKCLYYGSANSRDHYREKQKEIYQWCIDHKQELNCKHSAFPTVMTIAINVKSFSLFQFLSDTYCVLKLYGWKKLVYDHKCIFVGWIKKLSRSSTRKYEGFKEIR